MRLIKFIIGIVLIIMLIVFLLFLLPLSISWFSTYVLNFSLFSLENFKEVALLSTDHQGQGLIMFCIITVIGFLLYGGWVISENW